MQVNDKFNFYSTIYSIKLGDVSLATIMPGLRVISDECPAAHYM